MIGSFYCAYHVGKWFKYDRFGSNSSRPSLGSHLMVWCTEICSSVRFWPFPTCLKWPFWGELVILGPEEVCLGYLQSLHCPGLGWSGRSGVRSCRTRSHGPKAPRLPVAYNLHCLTLFHVSIINITWFESTGTHMAPTALFRYVHLQLNYAEERDPGMQDVI